MGVQEVDVNTTRNSYDMLAKFAELGVYTNTAFQKSINMSDGVGEYGIDTHCCIGRMTCDRCYQSRRKCESH